MTYDMDRPQRFIYGRRQAPRLKPNQKRLIEELLPQLRVMLPEPIEPTKLADLGLRQDRPMWLEIGFGGGEHLAATAKANPNIDIVGVEPYVTGVAKLLSEVEKNALGNVCILVDDARLLLKSLPDRCLDRAFILYPDPWPKARHNKRRIVNDDTVTDLARLLKPGAELRLATDHADYLVWILAVMRRHRDFQWQAESKRDWQERPVDQLPTRYEEKAISAGRRPTYLRFERADDA